MRQLKPCTSSMHSLILRYAKASFLFKSAKLISKTRPFNPSDAIFVPCVFVMRVRPQSLTAKMDGAVSLYHSFFKKGSTAFLRLPFLLFVSLLFLPCVFKTLGFETQSQGPGKIMLSVFLAAAIKNRRTKPVHKPVLPTHILVLSRRQTKTIVFVYVPQPWLLSTVSPFFRCGFQRRMHEASRKAVDVASTSARDLAREEFDFV